MVVSDYQLILGDCLEIMPTLEMGSVDAIIADWPYGTTACKWDSIMPLDKLWPECKRVINKNGSIVLFGSEPFSSLLRVNDLAMYKYDWVWDKVVPTNFQLANYQPMKNHESILVFSALPAVFVKYGCSMTYNPQLTPTSIENIRPKKNGRLSQNMTRIRSGKHIHKTPEGVSFPKSIITINRYNAECNPAAGKLHPTQKPVALLEYLIKTYTNLGDLVLDNTFGSCTTGEACLRTNRRFIGIEKDADYYQIGVNRMKRVEAELRGDLNHLPMFAEESND